MSQGSGVLASTLPAREPERLRRTYLGAITYPFWHLVAPHGAADPWWLWWVAASPFAIVTVLSFASPWIERRLRLLFPLCGWVVTLHMFGLAAANEMHPFYVVASALIVLSTVLLIRDRRSMISYAAFVMALVGSLYAIEPSATKLVYWGGGLVPILSLSYMRLHYQLRREEMDRVMARELEARVEARTRELQRANAQLQTEIAERERLEGQLRFAHKMEVLGRVAGGMAHDFNNLLTTVGVYAELVMEGLPEGSPLRDDAQQIRKTVRQASALTEQLLALSRRGAAESRVLDLNELVIEASSMLRHLLPENIRVERRLHEGPAPVRVDPDQLTRVLMNLILNARDAMPDGGRLVLETSFREKGEVPVDVPRPLEDDGYVMLAVTDTGVGMDEETRTHAFEPFFTRKAPDHGTGLGLSIVYGILEQSRGHARILSEPGEGTRIELYWPRSAEPVRQDAQAGLRSQGGAQGGRERVLLVEDEPDLRQALARVLRSHGYELTLARDGEQALERAEGAGEAPFDLVVSDVVMPRMSGLELARRFRSRFPGTRLLLISGQLGHPSVREQEFPRAVAFLPKPFTPAELARKVRDVLDVDPESLEG